MSVISHSTLLTADEYARDAAAQIRLARSTIVYTTTTFRADDERSRAIVDALCDAADRGVSISICADTFTYLEPKEFILRSPRRQPARAIQAMKLERRLKSHGISFHWLGRNATSLAAGRTHSKWLVIDETVYSFGGVNMDNESFSNTDYMLKFSDKTLADFIVNEHARVLKADRGGGARRSRLIELNTSTRILIDGGLIFDSLIYRRACKLAREADAIILVSQYCPTGRLNRILKRKNATLYFNHWRHASSLNRFLITFGMFTAKQQTHYSRNAYLHAKFIIFTMPDGHRIALAGSHNFMFGSGVIGTKEIAIETTDPYIIEQLEQFRAAYVA